MNTLHIHSFVDVITNSSTVIYTYQDKCVPAAKELIGEVLKMLNESKTVDDLFSIEIVTEEEGNEDFDKETSLIIKAKDLKYDTLAKKIISFLNSSQHESSYNG